MRGSHSRIAVLLRWVGAAIGVVAAAAGCVTMLLTAACGQPCTSTPDTAGRGSAGGELRVGRVYARTDGGAASAEAGVAR